MTTKRSTRKVINHISPSVMKRALSTEETVTQYERERLLNIGMCNEKMKNLGLPTLSVALSNSISKKRTLKKSKIIEDDKLGDDENNDDMEQYDGSEDLEASSRKKSKWLSNNENALNFCDEEFTGGASAGVSAQPAKNKSKWLPNNDNALDNCDEEFTCAVRVPTQPTKHKFIPNLNKRKKAQATGGHDMHTRSQTKQLSQGGRPKIVKLRNMCVQETYPEDTREHCVQGDVEAQNSKGDNSTEGSSKRRGETKLEKLHLGGTKRYIELNKNGQPIRPAKHVSLLSSYCGLLAKSAMMVPFTCNDWRKIPQSRKEVLWRKTNERFILDEKAKRWVLFTIAKAWRTYKCVLRANYFDPENGGDKTRPKKIPPSQWEALTKFWKSEEGMKRSRRNAANREKQMNMHRKGRKSFAQVREELREEYGHEPSDALVFLATRTGKDGVLVVDEESRSDVEMLVSSVKGDNSEEICEKEILNKLVKPRSGCVPLRGKGVTPTQMKSLDSSFEEKEKIKKLREEITEELTKTITENVKKEVVTAFAEYFREANVTLPPNICGIRLDTTGSNNAPQNATPEHLPSSAGNNSVHLDENEDNDGDEEND